ncbi:MAG: response regulator transcription factor [Candidatus Dormibacteria bacterium]
MRVLLVDDDQRLLRTVKRGLTEAGFSVDDAADGIEALAAVSTTPFDAIVLDVMLPGDRDGFEVCSELRHRRIKTPVLMLTARDAIEDRVRGLEVGADDYLVKPFAFQELLARLRALTRRHLENRSSILELGPLKLDTSSRTVTVGGERVMVTRKEFAILEYFLHNPGRVLSREQVEEHVWNYDFDRQSNLVEVYVGRIRRKLAAAGMAEAMVTVRGYGYRFEVP